LQKDPHCNEGTQESKNTEKVLRVAKASERVLERDVIGAINIGLRYLNSDGSPVALGSTRPMRRG